MSKSFAFILLTLAFTITYVSACWCKPYSNEDKFCKYDFAKLFYIMDNTSIFGNGTSFDIEFDVQTLKTYRTVNATNYDDTKLYTPGGTQTCGIILDKDAYYVLSGYYLQRPGRVTRMIVTKCTLRLYFASDPRFPPNKYEPPECNEPEPPEPEENYNADGKLN